MVLLAVAVTSGVGLEGCREGKAGGGLSGDVLVVVIAGGARHPGVRGQRGGPALGGW